MLGNCVFPAGFPAGRGFPVCPFSRRSSRDAGCLGTLGGRAGAMWWLLVWAARDGAGPAVVPPSFPSWQLLLNLPFIACQKSGRAVLLPPCPLILTFIILQAVPALPSVFSITVGGQELCLGSALPPRPSPQMFFGLPVVGGSLESSGLTRGGVGAAALGRMSGPAAESASCT